MLAELARTTARLSFDIVLHYDDGETDKETCTFVINDDVVNGLTINRSIDGFCLAAE